MHLEVEEHLLPLKRPFRIARHVKSEQLTIVVKLHAEGKVGLGEASPNAYYGVDLSTMRDTLSRVARHFRDCKVSTLAEHCDQVRMLCGPDSFSQAAVDIALHDLFSRLQGVPVWQMIGGTCNRLPNSSITIGIGSLEDVHISLDESPGWPCYKVKLSNDCDAAAILQLIQQREPNATLRVDGNCGFQPEEALQLHSVLQRYRVEMFEQPLPANSWQEMPTLFAKYSIPLIADESCRSLEDIPRCADCFHGINIKLGKCGGITPALAMIRDARRLGLRVMIGCMTESSIAMSAAAQLAGFVDDLDIDGALLLSRDLVSGFSVDKGVVQLANRPGLGIFS